MPLYDYTCEGGHTTESRQGYGVTAIPCQCGLLAERQSVYVQHQVGLAVVPLSERRYGKQLSLFKEATAERDYAYNQVEKEVGHSVQAPDLWSVAKQRAGVTT